MMESLWLAGLLFANIWTAGGVNSDDQEQAPASGTPAPVAVRPWEQDRPDNYLPKVIPPLEDGDDGSQPPSNQEILAALPAFARGIPYVYDQYRDDLSITTEKLVDRVDPPRFFPLIGTAQLHHVHWKCTVTFTQVVEIQNPLPFTCRTQQSEVVYIDKDHLHLSVEKDEAARQRQTAAEMMGAAETSEPPLYCPGGHFGPPAKQAQTQAAGKIYVIVATGEDEQNVTVLPAREQSVTDAVDSVDSLPIERIRKVRVYRDGGETILLVDWKAIVQADLPATNYQLEAGDRVFVYLDRPSDSERGRQKTPAPMTSAGPKAVRLDMIIAGLDREKAPEATLKKIGLSSPGTFNSTWTETAVAEGQQDCEAIARSLQEPGALKVLAHPRMTVDNGSWAAVAPGSDVPPGQPEIAVRAYAYAMADGTIQLEIAADVTTRGSDGTYSTRYIHATKRLDQGGTLLFTGNYTEIIEAEPVGFWKAVLIGLGAAEGSAGDQTFEREMLIIVTPHVEAPVDTPDGKSGDAETAGGQPALEEQPADTSLEEQVLAFMKAIFGPAGDDEPAEEPPVTVTAGSSPFPIASINAGRLYVVVNGGQADQQVEVVAYQGQTVLDLVTGIDAVTADNVTGIWVTRHAPDGSGGFQVISIDWKLLMQTGQSGVDLEAGDRLSLTLRPETADSNVYVVIKGGSEGEEVSMIPFNGQSVLDLIGDLDGVTADNVQKIWVTRPGGEDEEDTVIEIDWKSLIQSGRAGVELAPGDRLNITIKADDGVTIDDVVRMSSVGASDDVIIRQMELTNAAFDLTCDDIVYLREQGVSNRIIRAMQERRASSMVVGGLLGTGVPATVGSSQDRASRYEKIMEAQAVAGQFQFRVEGEPNAFVEIPEQRNTARGSDAEEQSADAQSAMAPVAELLAAFSDEWTCDGSKTSIGLAARVYLLAKNSVGKESTVDADGCLFVEVFDLASGAPVKVAEWRFDADSLKNLKHVDIVGAGYTVFLPWDNGRPKPAQVELRVVYMPENVGQPVHAEPQVLHLRPTGKPEGEAAPE